jgi:hypothetical protein
MKAFIELNENAHHLVELTIQAWKEEGEQYYAYQFVGVAKLLPGPELNPSRDGFAAGYVHQEQGIGGPLDRWLSCKGNYAAFVKDSYGGWSLYLDCRRHGNPLNRFGGVSWDLVGYNPETKELSIPSGNGEVVIGVVKIYETEAPEANPFHRGVESLYSERRV